MIDPVSFLWGVLGGQGSLIIAFILAKVTRPLLNEKFKKEKQGGLTCPRCQSHKVAYTQEPGLLWCQSCGKEFQNGETNNKKEPAEPKESTPAK